MTMCQACERGEHANCGMQSWCDCKDENDGNPDAPYHPPEDDDGVFEESELDEAMYNCHGWFEDNGKGAFMCGAVGSEDCDMCPFYSDLGLTAKQIDERDDMSQSHTSSARGST